MTRLGHGKWWMFQWDRRAKPNNRFYALGYALSYEYMPITNTWHPNIWSSSMPAALYPTEKDLPTYRQEVPIWPDYPQK